MVMGANTAPLFALEVIELPPVSWLLTGTCWFYMLCPPTAPWSHGRPAGSYSPLQAELKCLFHQEAFPNTPRQESFHPPLNMLWIFHMALMNSILPCVPSLCGHLTASP